MRRWRTSHRRQFRRVLDVGVVCETPAAQVRQAIEIIRQVLADPARQSHYPPDMPPRVYFNGMAESCLNINAVYWFTPTDKWAFQEFNQEVNLEILQRLEEAGIGLAYRTQAVVLHSEGAAGRAAPPPAAAVTGPRRAPP